MKILNINKKYFPFVLGLLSGLSVFYFLYFFRAYGIQTGISYSGHSHLFRAISFGLTTFIFFTIMEYFIKPQFTLPKVFHQLLWYFCLVVIGSNLIFILFNYFWNWQEWDLMGYLLIMKEFPLMMIFPLVLYFLITFSSHTENVNDVKFQSETGKDKLIIKEANFLYATAEDNYVKIFHKTGESYKSHLIRKTLKSLETDLQDFPAIKRCHRGYMVNQKNITNIRQEKGKVLIDIGNDVIPVSKKYQPNFID